MSAEGAGQVMASTASGRPPAVMVTGGAGLVGSHLVDRLVERGFRVVVVDDLSSGSRDNLHDHLDGAGGGEPRVVLVQHDVCQVIDDQLAGPHLVGADRFETVFHLASPASPPDYLSRPVHTLETGSLGTMHTLAVAERHRARYLLTSTSEIYGDPEVHPQPETYWGNVNPVGPRSVYDEAKRFAESLVTAHGRARGTDVRIVRLFNTYGPRMRPEDGRVVSNFVAQALAGRPLTIFGDGTQTRSFGFVDDTVAGILAVLESDLTTPVNVGNPAEFTMLELAGLVAELTGSASPGLEFLPLPEDDPVQRRPDITLVQRHTGWEPTVQLREGLERTISWMRTHLGHRLG